MRKERKGEKEREREGKKKGEEGKRWKRVAKNKSGGGTKRRNKRICAL